MQKLGMVIINYNDFKTTEKLLKNVKNYSCLDKIVVVDNHSTDNSVQKLKKLESKKIVLLENNRNNGYASGMNLGASYLIKELGDCHIIFSNADVIIQNEKDLIQLSSDMKDDVVVVGPVILEHDTYNRGWKVSSTFVEILLNLPLISRYFKKKFLYYKDSHYESSTSLVDVVSGCFFMVDSKVLQAVDFFDEHTFLYYEELIFACKVKKIGKKILVDNQVSVIHDHSVTVDKNVSRIRKYRILKTSQQYYVKNYLNANSFQLACLFITNKISLFLLYVRGLFHK